MATTPAGAVGGETGAGKAAAAKRTLGDGAVCEAAEGAAPVVHFIDGPGRFLAHLLHGRLVGQIIATFDRVKRMTLPGVVLPFGVIAEGGVDAALGGNRVGTHGMDLGNNGGIQRGLRTHRSTQTRQSTAYDQDLVFQDVCHQIILIPT
jgi:hypothetical protein